VQGVVLEPLGRFTKEQDDNQFELGSGCTSAKNEFRHESRCK
jgi:hypothetical protein